MVDEVYLGGEAGLAEDNSWRDDRRECLEGEPCFEVCSAAGLSLDDELCLEELCPDGRVSPEEEVRSPDGRVSLEEEVRSPDDRVSLEDEVRSAVDVRSLDEVGRDDESCLVEPDLVDVVFAGGGSSLTDDGTEPTLLLGGTYGHGGGKNG